MSKAVKYQELVTKRKACDVCERDHCYLNQSVLRSEEGESFDTDEIGNFSTWANDLNADLMIVAQDFSDKKTFVQHHGRIQLEPLAEDARVGQYSTATNFYLRELTKSIDRDIGLPPSEIGSPTRNTHKGIFTTNAVLCMKPGNKMNAANPVGCVEKCGRNFLKPLIDDVIRPKAIVTLGAVATMSVLSLYTEQELAKLLRSTFREIFFKAKDHPINLTSDGLRLFPMYHPGWQGRSNRKRAEKSTEEGWDLMKKDWKEIGDAMGWV